VITSIGIVGTPRQLPDGYRTVDRAVGVNDLLRPMKVASGAITIVAVLLWIVAALIVGSLVYLSAARAPARFPRCIKAIGVPTRSILAGLALQAVRQSRCSRRRWAPILAQVLAPLFPMTVVVPMRAYLLLPAIAIAIGLLASGAGLRRAGGGRSRARVRRSLSGGRSQHPGPRRRVLQRWLCCPADQRHEPRTYLRVRW